MSPDVKPACPRCGCSDVSAETHAYFDTDKQRWVVSEVYDDEAYCRDCDTNTHLIWSSEYKLLTSNTTE